MFFCKILEYIFYLLEMYECDPHFTDLEINFELYKEWSNSFKYGVGVV